MLQAAQDWSNGSFSFHDLANRAKSKDCNIKLVMETPKPETPLNWYLKVLTPSLDASSEASKKYHKTVIHIYTSADLTSKSYDQFNSSKKEALW